MGEAIGGDIAVFEKDGAAEVVSLNEREALYAGLLVLFAGFDLLGDEGDGVLTEALQQPFPLQGTGLEEVDFDIVGEGDKRRELRFPDKVVEGKAKAGDFELAAGFDHSGSGLDIFEDFEDGHAGWQDVDEGIGERFAGAVDEGGYAAGEILDAEEDGVVEHGAGGHVAIAGEAGLDAVSVEQFVAVEAAAEIEDGLTGNIAKPFRKVRLSNLFVLRLRQGCCHRYVPSRNDYRQSSAKL